MKKEKELRIFPYSRQFLAFPPFRHFRQVEFSFSNFSELLLLQSLFSIRFIFFLPPFLAAFALYLPNPHFSSTVLDYHFFIWPLLLIGLLSFGPSLWLAYIPRGARWTISSFVYHLYFNDRRYFQNGPRF